jgi:adenine-specific DNA-methyltransferase
MSTYGAYAKKLKSNSEKDIFFALPKAAEKASYFNDVWMCDSNELIKNISGDILYLDPPYNNRQYGSNYHVLNSIAVGEAPETDSVTGVKAEEYNKSDYCREKTVGKALDELIANAKFEWIFLSYNNEGLLSFDEIKAIMSKYGDYSVEGTEYQRYKADNNRKQSANGVVEYIHILHKGVFTQKETPDEDPYRSMAEGMQIPEKHHITLKTKIKLNPFTLDVKPDVKLESIPINFTVTKDGVEFKDDDKIVVSPMNYMGGKKKLIKTLKEYFPKDVDIFVDLFCGGATVGINSDAKTVIFNDNLKPLIWMYIYMFNHSVEDCLSYIDSTIEKYGLVQGKEGEANYYNFRDNHYNALPVEKRHPLDLFVLMAYSFNNQIRFNVKKDWKFNIPFGANRSSFNSKMRENLIGFINALHERDCVFSEQDFRDFPCFENMFVYADPPYLISQATYNDGWDEESENTLLRKLNHWSKKGVKFALSNVLENKGETNEILKNWAEENGYFIFHLDKSYANSYYHRKDRESKTDEVLITNYPVEEKSFEENGSDI